MRQRKARLAARPILYIAIIIGVVLVTYAYKLRTEGIFACQADGYTSDRYLAYCHATGYGDYEHGVFWLGLEPSAQDFATNAEVLFLGDSRLQLALSTAATADWFISASARYYLLGFSYGENAVFAGALLRKLRARAKVYVINVDDRFFSQVETPPTRTLMGDSAVRIRYEAKRIWQAVHEPICSRFPAICGDQYVVFRSRETGAYRVRGVADWFTHGGRPVSADPDTDQSMLETSTASGRDFLSRLPVEHECVIFTIIPTVRTKIGTANAITAALGLRLLAPELDGLQTFDGSHLDQASAERWSEAFLRAAAPQIQKCLDRSLNLHSRS